MRVNAKNEVARTEGNPSAKAPRKAAAGTDKVDLKSTDNLHAALNATPEIRADKVAKAKQLVQDPNYPSAKVLSQVAKTLAQKIRHQD